MVDVLDLECYYLAGMQMCSSEDGAWRGKDRFARLYDVLRYSTHLSNQIPSFRSTSSLQ